MNRPNTSNNPPPDQNQTTVCEVDRLTSRDAGRTFPHQMSQNPSSELPRKRDEMLAEQAKENLRLLQAVDQTYMNIQQMAQKNLARMNEQQQANDQFRKQCEQWNTKVDGHTQVMAELMRSLGRANKML